MNNSINIERYKHDNPYWWSANIEVHKFLCSDYLMEICGMQTADVNISNFMMLVKPTHRDRVQSVIIGSVIDTDEKVSFELLTKFGYRWANMRGVKVGGSLVGCVEFMTQQQMQYASDEDDRLLLNESVERYTAVSNILMELNSQKDIPTIINKILSGLITTFKCDRAYLFEYDLRAGVQSCVYEEVAEGVVSSIKQLQNIPIAYTKWFNAQILTHKIPIICDDIKNLPRQAAVEYQILKDQNIDSFIVMPFWDKDEVVGYIGLDIVGRKHSWSNADKLWFKSLTNLISLCVALKKSEGKAQRDHKYYRELYDNMPVGLVKLRLVSDANGTPTDYQLLEMNNIACSIFGVQIDSYRGSYGSLTQSHISYFNKRLLKFANILKNREVYHDTMTFDEDQKTNRYLDYTVFPVDVDGIVILFQDKTSTVVTSRALRKSEETLENIYNNIPVGIEIYDKDGILISLNDVEQQMFGYKSKEDVLGINLFDNPNVPRFFLEDLRSGKSSWCDFYYDFDNLNKYYDSGCTGRKHIVLKGSILYDIDNNIENYLLIVLDNTDTLKANHKIHEFESLFNSIAEFAEIGLSQWNLKNKTLYGTDQWHDNLCSQEGSTDDVMSCYCNVNDDDRVKLQANFDNIINGVISSFRQELRVKSGDVWKWLRTNYKVSHGEEGVEIVGINVDITEMKITEDSLIKAKSKAEESDKLKLSFLANMSHEIRTPLNAINGFSDLLVSIDDVTEREQYSKIIKQNSDSLLQLISDILDLSKIDSGMADLFLEPVNLHGVCRDVLMLGQTRSTSGIEFRFEPQTESCMVYSDSKRLTQIMTNLINNASKFTKKGSVTIGYTVNDYQAQIFIRDTGIGIDEESKNSIFNRFVKLNDFIPGTGLGLSICQQLVEMLGGQIWLESTVGVGSCFYFTQPLDGVVPAPVEVPVQDLIAEQTQMPIAEVVLDKVSEAEAISIPITAPIVATEPSVAAAFASTPVAPTMVVSSSTEKPVILIAEDTDSNYLLFSTMLKREYTLYRANNGREAVDMFSKYNPAMVLMDIRMPIMDGLEATKLIKVINPSVPVIVLTAFAYSDDRTRAAEAGCNGFLTKPVNYKELKDVIRLHLESMTAK